MAMSLAQYFHDRTKYDPDTLEAKAKPLDWSRKPPSFKEFRTGETIDLKPYLREAVDVVTEGAIAQQWARLSKFLYCSYGLTARVDSWEGEPVFLRAAPSAGGLYPAEIYLVSAGTPVLRPGLFGYQPRTHSLVHYWSGDPWPRLLAACGEHPALRVTRVAIVVTAVFERSAWRYQDRAYRRVGLDTGHLLGNLDLAATLSDFRTCHWAGFADKALNEVLFVDGEEEAALVAIALLDRQTNPPQTVAGYPTAWPSLGVASYPRLAEGHLLTYLHHASCLDHPPRWDAEVVLPPAADKYNFPFCQRVPMATAPLDWGPHGQELESTLLRRRSTRAFRSEAMDLSELQALLHFTYQPESYGEAGLNPHPDFFARESVSTFLAVTRVTGLEQGCYYYAPQANELRQIRFSGFEQELHFLCLGQELGRDAAVVIFHTANLEAAIAHWGERAYRYLHLDAGHLGQRLNLAAIRLGLGVSGIAGFFDDAVNEVLGIPATEAVLYITVVGQPR
ncbi:MAG TPA: SagB-type dehydrogenase domain-containing protein [Cyanobacteria bacterium UBA8156]|nr:SagB-type dehydrogenase domain-containing protein [Cyanobacteria bacterium UBA8156]